jgi:hypothetical protein
MQFVDTRLLMSVKLEHGSNKPEKRKRSPNHLRFEEREEIRA